MVDPPKVVTNPTRSNNLARHSLTLLTTYTTTIYGDRHMTFSFDRRQNGNIHWRTQRGLGAVFESKHTVQVLLLSLNHTFCTGNVKIVC